MKPDEATVWGVGYPIPGLSKLPFPSGDVILIVEIDDLVGRLVGHLVGRLVEHLVGRYSGPGLSELPSTIINFQMKTDDVHELD